MPNVAVATPGKTGAAFASGKSVVTTPEERAAALAFLGNLAAEASAGNVHLPSFPDVVVHIREALADPNARTNEIVRIVGTEPRLAALLIQAANSAAFNPAGKSFTDLRAAITRLGHRPVQSSAMAFAVRQLRLAPALRSISEPLNALWEESISVASICQVVARRTTVNPDEAFLTGLLHGIGRLYIMVRAVGKNEKLCRDHSLMEMIEGWHPAIGKAVLESWGFTDAMAEAVGAQTDYDRNPRSEANLTDVLIVGVQLAMVLRQPTPQIASMEGVSSYQRMGLTAQDCAAILMHAEHQLGALHAALGC